ncbi:MAG: TolC family protein [Flavobacteriaceae bacterium]|jgi:outer membrane protein|nr:TolC family protein [Flavobacteriaceae bacterium]MBT4314188.1 TolC family protein [Flavobacteriaceae bacterium]MBT5090999.1 TolC family protein [Flavobacteriaceae bacterium]MBT5284086.1 TolC family protein [Flavobacteriaceae bacterium]MBT5446759.1 TolC family protein [Flavobacteriaceae bacterium]
MKGFIVFILINLVIYPLLGQQTISKEEALEIALEKNFGIQVSKNNLEISKNNSSLLNSGFLPTISLNGGSNFTSSNSEIAFPGQVLEDGSPRPNLNLDDQESQRFNGGVNLNYTLFDGLGRKFTYKRLKEQYALSELQLRETIEFTIIQLYSVYFNVAQLTESKSIFKQALEVSKERESRAESAFKYGQTNKLAVLNAQVDVTNDSISVLEITQQLDNAKRDLNLLLSQSMENKYSVSTQVDFVSEIQIEALLENAAAYNVSLLKQKQNTQINSYDVKVSQSGYLPSIGLVGSYGWNLNQSPASAFFPGTNNNTYSMSFGANLSWNLFDGGRSITRVKNAKIAVENQKILTDEIQLTFERDLSNALQSYKNAKMIYSIQEKQVETGSYNFERSQAQYNLGSITAIEFRQAQINLRNAQNQWTLAKYQAKLAELRLLQLSGQLLNISL